MMMGWVHAGLVSMTTLGVQQGARRSGSPDLTPLLGWIGLAIALLVIAGVVLMFLRRRMLGLDDTSNQATMFEDLRLMRDRGELSDEEYASIRATMVERAKASLHDSGHDSHDKPQI